MLSAGGGRCIVKIGEASRRRRAYAGGMEMTLHKLSPQQVGAYDTEFVDERGMQAIRAAIDADFPDGRFSFLDVGGGNGVFADQLLERYPQARATVIDSSPLMIERNRAHPGKRALLGDAADVPRRGETFDLVFCNLVLHHLVTTGSYARTRRNVEQVLGGLMRCLSPAGRVSVYEMEFNGWIDDFPGHAIFALTSSRVLAPVVRRLGGNTAGVGACFRSHRAWCRLFAQLGLELLRYTRHEVRTFPGGLRRRLLLIDNSGYAHYWLRPHR